MDPGRGHCPGFAVVMGLRTTLSERIEDKWFFPTAARTFAIGRGCRPGPKGDLHAARDFIASRGYDDVRAGSGVKLFCGHVLHTARLVCHLRVCSNARTRSHKCKDKCVCARTSPLGLVDPYTHMHMRNSATTPQGLPLEFHLVARGHVAAAAAAFTGRVRGQ